MTTKMIIIEGDEAVKAKLTAIAAEAPAKLQMALVAGGLIIQNDAKARAPYKTSALKRSIHIEQLGGFLGIQIGTNLIYAATQEFGRAGGGWNGSDIPARPYLRPAVDQNLVRVATEIASVFRKLLQI